MTAVSLSASTFINRERSWIQFNQRVLAQALNPQTPLLEQARFSAIFSNNLDEFFMVRVASLKSQVEAGVDQFSLDGRSPLQQLLDIREQLTPLLQQQQNHYKHDLVPRLQEHGVEVLRYTELNSRQQDWTTHYFQSLVFAVLTPLAVDSAHPFPFISNLSLNIAVLIQDSATGSHQFARVKVPRSLPRFVDIPTELSTLGSVCTVVLLEEIIAHNLDVLFPGTVVTGHYFFRVTRDADLEYLELEADDLLQAIEASLRKRRLEGRVVRLEVDEHMPQAVVDQLMAGMAVEEEDLYCIRGPLGLDDLFQLTTTPRPQLRYPPHQGRVPPPFRRAQKSLLADGSLPQEEFESVFDVIRRGDVLVYHPYDLFAGSVEEFINQAADDPDVLAIKLTLYRLSKESAIVDALERASEQGKQVLALVELKARFDEDNNIQWARQLERAGVHVVYGVLGYKTHTKVTLVVRKERHGVRSYAHIGTGNYNVKTSRFYTDLGLFTCRPMIGQDLVELFNYFTGYGKQQRFRRLLVAPVTLRDHMEAMIKREVEHARAQRGGHIRAKMNSLVDPAIIQALYGAAQAGVRIELVVRGMCSLRAGVPGLSESIRVVSIIGPFLEHSRIFWFRNGGNPEAYIGSADWMTRNLDRRVECLTPVEDPLLRQKLEALLSLYLQDNCGAWQMEADGSYRPVPRRQDEAGRNAQSALIQHWQAAQGKADPAAAMVADGMPQPGRPA
ncbi:MAG: polyphosphate kinase 1 [Synechococcus sp. SB0677_bin_5]|nr:polyphosphate kinase 1 [Synechococcus sp. SB0677_bin_5]